MTKPLLLSISLFLIALAMRFHALQAISIWLDEDSQAQVGLAYNPWQVRGIFRGAAVQEQPPVDYFLTDLSIHTFGKNMFAVRFFPAFLSSATVPVFFWAVFVLTGSLWPALLGSAVLLFNPYLLIYAHEGRPYSTALFLEACFFLALVCSLKYRKGYRWLTLVAVIFLLSLSMQPPIVIVGVGIGLLVAQGLTGKRLLERRLCLAVIAALLLGILPFALILHLSPFHVPHTHAAFSVTLVSQQVLAAAIKISKLWEIQRWPARVFCVAALVVLGARAFRRQAFEEIDVLFIAVCVALLLFPVFVQGLFIMRDDRKLEPRYLLATLPLFALAVALAGAILEHATQAIPWRLQLTRGLAAVSVIFLAIQLISVQSDVYSKAYIYHDDWRGAFDLFRAPENKGATAYVWTLPDKGAWTPDGMIGSNFYYPDNQPRPVSIRAQFQITSNVPQIDQMLSDIAAHRNPPYIFLVTTKAWNLVYLPIDKLPADLEAKEWNLCNMQVVRITNHNGLAETLQTYFSAYRDFPLPPAASEKLATVLRRLSEIQPAATKK